MAKNNASYYAVFTNGKIDKEASFEKFAKDFAEFESVTEAANTLVLPCLNEFYDKNIGKRFSQEQICYEVINMIGKKDPSLDNVDIMPQLNKVIKDVLRKQIDAGNFNVGRGRHGGTGRTIDCPVPSKDEE
jgi:hypothetical protein